MKHLPTGLLLLALGLLSATALPSSPAFGQDRTPGIAIGEAMSVPEIRQCLCAKAAIDASRQEIGIQDGLIADREAELSALEQEIHRQRSTMDPADRTAQGILKALIQQQVALRGLLQSDLRPAFNHLVGELVRTIEAYNRDCATRVRFEADETAAMRNLQCPGP